MELEAYPEVNAVPVTRNREFSAGNAPAIANAML
jgi:hypothetical protein